MRAVSKKRGKKAPAASARSHWKASPPELILRFNALIRPLDDIERRKIHLPEPIKQLGQFTVPIKLGSEVEASLKLTVAAE